MMATWEGYRRNRGYQIFIMFAIYTGNTDTYTRGISYMQRIQGYQISTIATGRDTGETELSNIYNVRQTQATQTRIRGEFHT
jgi:hypothetical protein